MSTYADLWGKIAVAIDESGKWDNSVSFTLNWLDDHPGEVPRRTVTERELTMIAKEHTSIRDLVGLVGVAIVPDPEPVLTNLEKLTALMDEADAKDTPPISGGWEFIAKYLDAHGVKAPEDTNGWAGDEPKK